MVGQLLKVRLGWVRLLGMSTCDHERIGCCGKFPTNSTRNLTSFPVCYKRLSCFDRIHVKTPLFYYNIIELCYERCEGLQTGKGWLTI